MMFYELNTDVDREKLMDRFIKQDCVACGGNWSAMIISGMKYGRYWWLYDELDDNKSYSFFELVDMVYREIDKTVKNNIENNNKYMRERLCERMVNNGVLVGNYIRSNAYTSCEEAVIEYLGQYWCIEWVDGMVISLKKSTLEHGRELQRKTMLQRYE